MTVKLPNMVVDDIVSKGHHISKLKKTIIKILFTEGIIS